MTSTVIRERDLGQADGRSVSLFTLENPRGVTAQIMSYGAALVSLCIPDRDGRFADVALGFDDLDSYRADRAYLGAIVGRYANRIAGARFTLDGIDHQLAANDGANHLHGGLTGFDKVVWDAVPRVTPAGPSLALRHLSADGDEGYPGALSAEVIYTLTDDSALAIEYSATADRDTLVNLTHHGYWNLAGHAAGSIVDHRLTLAASRFAPVGAGLIPTGELRPVAGTPFDFRTAAAIGARIAIDDEQLRRADGFDHSFAIDGELGALRLAARVVEPASGRALEVTTTEPALQLYTGNLLVGQRGKAGARYPRRAGFCLETQHFPDSPHQPAFPTTILRRGARYQTTTIYRFSVS
jgi:aldose 1-epimerase